MNSCIQEYVMPKKERDYDNTVLSLRFTGAEAARFWRIMDEAKSRNPYVGKSDVYRELLGLAPPAALTEREIEYFRTGDKANGVELARQNKEKRVRLDMHAQIPDTKKQDAPKKTKQAR